MPRCKNCKKKFEPKKFLQKYCMEDIDCIKAYLESIKKDNEKKWNKEKKKKKEELKTKSDWLNDLQTIFNKYIRLRDNDLPCISCGTTKKKQYHAGHYRTRGHCPELRFNELNCHKQCSTCNNYKSGNIVEYRINLIKRIGDDNVNWLEGNHEPLRLTIADIKELIIEYKKKIKDFEKTG